MVVRVAMSGRWSYAALNLDPGKQRGRGQEMVVKTAVALSDHGDRFGQTIFRVCTIRPEKALGCRAAGGSGVLLTCARERLRVSGRDPAEAGHLQGPAERH